MHLSPHSHLPTAHLLSVFHSIRKCFGHLVGWAGVTICPNWASSTAGEKKTVLKEARGLKSGVNRTPCLSLKAPFPVWAYSGPTFLLLLAALLHSRLLCAYGLYWVWIPSFVLLRRHLNVAFRTYLADLRWPYLMIFMLVFVLVSFCYHSKHPDQRQQGGGIGSFPLTGYSSSSRGVRAGTWAAKTMKECCLLTCSQVHLS